VERKLRFAERAAKQLEDQRRAEVAEAMGRRVIQIPLSICRMEVH
jgi:hypothetical protein